MCGFGGELTFKGEPANEKGLRRMSAALAARGPDGEGFFIENSVGVVHRRLAIVDLSFTGAQPMIHADSGDVLVYNGEIYNYQELRQVLIDEGEVFIGNSDTEVLLAGLKRYGLEFVSRLNGQFAFAFLHRTSGDLHLVRDRFGIKPLYWHKDSRRLLFASEIKALLAYGIGVEVDSEALDTYMALRYARGEKTIFKGIYKLQPGCTMTFSKEGMSRAVRYWQLNPSEARVTAEDLTEKLRDSVRARLRADVEVGLFLSGGIDSSSIAHFVPEATKAWTYRMPDSQDADQAASWANERRLQLRTCAHEEEGFFRAREMIVQTEEPIGDSVLLPYSRLFREARADVKVALSGEGADEVFGGYVHHQLARGLHRSWRNLRKSPNFVRAAAGSFVERLPLKMINMLVPYPVEFGHESLVRAGRVLRASEPWQIHLAMAELFSAEERHRLLGGRSKNLVDLFHRENWPDRCGDDLFMQFLLFDLRYWLADYGLLRTDKLSMALGLEIRLPYLDHGFVESALSYLQREHGDWRKNKRLLRQMMRSRLPERIRKRSKHPFFLNPGRGYADGYGRYIREILEAKRVARFGFLDPKYIEDLAMRPEKNFVDHKKLTSLLHFQLWCEAFLA